MKNQTSQDSPQGTEGSKLVRVIKSIIVNPEIGRSVDESVIRFEYYNSFNYSFLSRDSEGVSMTLGITSPKPAEGKTLVACNLAVSLAMGSRKKTVLVDLNVYNPCLHRIFGTAKGPGLAEALRGGNIHVNQTQIDNLAVLTADNFVAVREPKDGAAPSAAYAAPLIHPALSLEQLAAFRDTVYSLEQEFEFVIVDMPSLSTQGFPVLYANQLNGLVVVVNAGTTKREEISGIFHQINERQVLGFVFNRFDDGGER
jgi:Mrp family chromosome partitioning ATPase